MLPHSIVRFETPGNNKIEFMQKHLNILLEIHKIILMKENWQNSFGKILSEVFTKTFLALLMDQISSMRLFLIKIGIDM